MRWWLALPLVLFAVPSAAQREPEWRTAPEYEVLLHPFNREPPVIRLPAGQPARLRFINGGRAAHSFTAPRLFRSSRLRPRDGDLVVAGRFRLDPGDRRTVALIPSPGRYRVASVNVIHQALGMRATIIVE